MPRPGDEQPPREDGGPRGEELPVPGLPAALREQATAITDDISKLTIVHETVLGSDFKVQAASFSPKSLENRVKETLHKAFWDSLEEQLSASPQDYAWAIQLLQEMEEALISLLLPRHNQLRSQIEEALDMESIRQEAEHGALDVHGLTTEIFQVLGLMKMGMLNFTIQSLRTHLQDHTIQYEWKKFQELLDKLPNSLDRTRERLCKAAAQVSASSSQPPPRPAVSGSTCRTLAGGRQQ